jgi:hypothetical protein
MKPIYPIANKAFLHIIILKLGDNIKKNWFWLVGLKFKSSKQALA